MPQPGGGSRLLSREVVMEGPPGALPACAQSASLAGWSPSQAYRAPGYAPMFSQPAAFWDMNSWWRRSPEVGCTDVGCTDVGRGCTDQQNALVYVGGGRGQWEQVKEWKYVGQGGQFDTVPVPRPTPWFCACIPWCICLSLFLPLLVMWLSYASEPAVPPIPTSTTTTTRTSTTRTSKTLTFTVSSLTRTVTTMSTMSTSLTRTTISTSTSTSTSSTVTTTSTTTTVTPCPTVWVKMPLCPPGVTCTTTMWNGLEGPHKYGDILYVDPRLSPQQPQTAPPLKAATTPPPVEGRAPSADAPEPFNCSAGLENWVKGWSSGKKDWCCENHELGCAQETPALPEPPQTTPPPVPETPSSTRPSSTTVPTGPQTCRVYGDPHVITFDGRKVSFYSTGEYWLVKSFPVAIQARYMATPVTNGLSVTKVLAIGGDILGRHLLRFSAQYAMWDEEAILTEFPSKWTSTSPPVSIVYDAEGEYLQEGREGKQLRVVKVTLPMGVSLQINRWNEPGEGDYMNVKIFLSGPLPNQDGQCGNFNGDPADDSRAALKERLGSSSAWVADEDLLFKERTPVVKTADPSIDDCPADKMPEAEKLCGKISRNGIPEKECIIDVCFGGEMFAAQDAADEGADFST